MHNHRTASVPEFSKKNNNVNFSYCITFEYAAERAAAAATTQMYESTKNQNIKEKLTKGL